MNLKKTKIPPFAFLVTSIVLSGCAQHLTLQQCQTMDWHQVGYLDGQQGKNQRDLQKDITDCARFKLKVNTKAYKRGWRSGTRVYCQPKNGFRLGVNGQRYNPICPANMTKAFDHSWHRGLRRYCIPPTGYNLGRAGKPFPDFCAPDLIVPFRNAYNDGFRIFRRQQLTTNELDNINSQIDQLQNHINDQRNDITDWQNQLDSDFPNLPRKQKQIHKRILHEKIRNAHSNIQDLEQQLNRLNRQKIHVQRQLNQIAAE